MTKERYELGARPGEIRTCANCHGINSKDQLGRTAPTNAPLALRKLLQLWRTNAANAYSLTVSSGSGSYPQGTLVTITASHAPAGQYFAQWLGASVSNAAAPLTFLLMPALNTNITATYSNVPPILIAAPSGGFGNTFAISAAGLPGLNYSVFASTNLNTTNGWRWVGTATAAPDGAIMFSMTNAAFLPQQFIQIRHP